MTDITELAQSMKAAAEKLKEIGIIHNYSKSVSAQIDFERSSTPANVIALVEALEKAQQHIARQEQILLNQDESLSIRRGELEAAHQRIAYLESRTVKLPPCVDDLHGIGMVMSAYAVVEALTSYGIKVEDE